jgi:hypothetical protein
VEGSAESLTPLTRCLSRHPSSSPDCHNNHHLFSSQFPVRPLSAINQPCGTLPRFGDTAGKGQALRERRAQVDVREYGMEIIDAGASVHDLAARK